MKTRTLLFLILFIIMPALSYGQLGRFIKNTVTKAAAKEAGREIDSAAQVKADKMAKENAANSQNENTEVNQAGSQSNQGGNFGGLFGGKVDLKYKEEYSFTSRLYMQTESYDKKEVMKMDLLMYFSANSPSVGIETKSITDQQGNSTPVTTSMVMDGENKCFLMLTDINGSKMGIISPIPDENAAQTQQGGKPVQKSTPPSFTKTGSTKVIAGYKCDEYSYTNPEDKTSGKVWFTKEANLNIDKRGWQKTGMGSYYGYAGFNEGILLANEAYDDKGKLTMKSETKEINPNFPHSIAVKGYNLRQMNLNQAPKR
jgi:hypothetical protein